MRPSYSARRLEFLGPDGLQHLLPQIVAQLRESLWRSVVNVVVEPAGLVYTSHGVGGHSDLQFDVENLAEVRFSLDIWVEYSLGSENGK